MEKRRFFRNIGWLLGGKIVNMLLQFFVSLATARYLGPGNFGTINYVAAYVSFFSSIASLGLAVIDIKEISTHPEQGNEIIWTSIIMRFMTAVLSTVCIVSLFRFKNPEDPQIVKIAFLESLSILFSAFDTFNYYFQARLLSKWSSIAGVLAYLGMSLFRICLLATGADIVWFAMATSMDMILLTIFLMIFYVRQEGFRVCFKRSLGKKLLKQSWHYLIAGLLMILYAQVDRIMLGEMLDTASVGYYSAALSISTLWSMIPSSLLESISPVLYETAGRDRNLYLRRMKQSYAVIFWLNAAYSILIMIIGRWLIVFLYGKDYLPALSALSIVVWYYGISTMSTLTQVYLSNDHKSRYINIFCLAGLITDVVLNRLLIPEYGIQGAAVATLITQIVIQMIMPALFKDTREISHLILEGISFKDVIHAEEQKELKKGIHAFFRH